jgi:hypothetical protein
VLLVVRAVQLEGLLTSDESAPDQFITVTNDDKSTSKQINPAYSSWAA